MSRGPDAATLLERALIRSAADRRCSAEIRESDWTRWASATFTGARHRLTLAVERGEAAERWLARLPETELALRGHLVADLVLAGIRRRDGEIEATIEALTVEDQ